MAYIVYVIVSLSSGNFYVGQTDNLILRYRHHCQGLVKSTKHLRPHVIGHVEIFEIRSAAMEREKQLKQHAGRDWIRNTVLPEIRRWYPTTQW